MKKIIPNILTISRLLVIPLVIYLGVQKQMIPLVIIAVMVALTDFLDGKLARLWNVTSELGAKLDTIGDKCLAFSLLIILVVDNRLFFYVFVLECFIALFNIYVFYRTRIVESLLIGKIKTWFLFVTIFLGFLDLLFMHIDLPVNLFVVLTALLQFASLIQYVRAYHANKGEKKRLQLENKEYMNIVRSILEHEEFLKRKEYPHHYNESVYDHVLRVSYDCYKIGKKLHLDYKALAIAGLLHDFYDKPWQSDFERKPFLQKHGFVHAEQARVNALKYFPKLMNDKIGSMIKTHMFPLNKRLPKYKESWVLTLVDKADSMDFLFHPLLMSTKFRKKTMEKSGQLCSKRKLSHTNHKVNFSK